LAVGDQRPDQAVAGAEVVANHRGVGLPGGLLNLAQRDGLDTPGGEQPFGNFHQHHAGRFARGISSP
jgi:hypothetical protein